MLVLGDAVIIAGFLLPLPAGSGKSALIKLSPVYLLYLRKSPRSGHERAGRRDKRGRKVGIGPESGGKSGLLPVILLFPALA